MCPCRYDYSIDRLVSREIFSFSAFSCVAGNGASVHVHKGRITDMEIVDCRALGRASFSDSYKRILNPQNAPTGLMATLIIENDLQ
jgi:hypothetical protein